MNILQHIPESRFSHVLVSLNPPQAPSEELTQAVISYRHPLYTAAAVAAQRELPSISGKRGVHFAGAWTGYGFHEDGLLSGVKAGLKCGGSVPWKVVETKEIRGRRGRTSKWTDLMKLAMMMVLIATLIVRFALKAPRRVLAWRRKRVEGEKAKREKRKMFAERMKLTNPDDAMEGSSKMHEG
jgi:hypothetical protein